MSKGALSDAGIKAMRVAGKYLQERNGDVDGVFLTTEIKATILAEREAAVAFAEQMAASCEAHAASYGSKDRLKAQASSAQAHVLKQFANLFATRHE